MALGHVRPAREADTGEIARIQLATWRMAYRRLVPHHVLDMLDEGWLQEHWQAAVTAPPSPQHVVLVAVEQPETPSEGAQSHLVGFAAIGPAEEAALAPDESVDAVPPGTAAITDLLVEPRWGRRGHGSRLLAAAVDIWRGAGFTRAVTWVFERDTAMLTFLNSAGWEPDGTRRALDMEGVLVPQIRVHVSFDETAPSH